MLRLRVLAATQRFTRTAGPPEPPLQSYAAHPAPRIGRGLAIIHRVMQQMQQEGSAAGARTAVMLMPARFQVNDEDYGHLRDAVTQSGGTLVRDAAGERIDQALRDIPVQRFDVLPPLRAAVADVFFQRTVHLTPRGHEIVAEALTGSSASRGCSMVFNSLHFVWFFVASTRSIGCCRTAHRTGFSLSPAITSMRRGTGDFSDS